MSDRPQASEGSDAAEPTAPPVPARPLAFRRTVRARLLLIALLPMLLILPVLLGATVASWSRRFDEALLAKVNGELTIAHQHLAGLLQSRDAAIVALARSADFAAVLAAGNSGLADFLEAERLRLGLDFLYLAPAGAQSRWPVVQSALAGQSRAEIDIFGPEDLARFSPDLAQRARLPLVPTPAAVPTDRAEETRGMVVHAAAPAPGGALVGGLLLNRNLAFIDEINELVYPAASLTEGSIGTATLFLDDVRISTNVRLFEDVRALGTRVSASVRARVLGEGQVWRDRAFVVNDWYISAYEPILDSFGNRVGMLYVGFLEAPFAEARLRTLWQIGAGFLVMLVLTVPVLLRWARGIFAPLEAMNATIARVEAGDLGARSGGTARDDEIGRLAAHLDSLLDQLDERDRRLRGWADELEERVAARTADLEEANRRLDLTTRQLIVSEKLAAIGEITAGMAHEINNPLAVIQGNLDVVRQELGPDARPLATEFRLIDEQIQAIHILVSKLLQFARPEEFPEAGTGHDPDRVARDTLPLVHHMLARSKVEIATDLAAGAQVAMNAADLQQVLVNLMINAIQAMPEGGRLALRSRPAGNGIAIEVSDTGIGMSCEVQAHIFDPFFTLRRGEGTGLGLSVSRNLIARAGGRIEVESAPGKGTKFTIWLPAFGRNG